PHSPSHPEHRTGSPVPRRTTTNAPPYVTTRQSVDRALATPSPIHQQHRDAVPYSLRSRASRQRRTSQSHRSALPPERRISPPPSRTGPPTHSHRSAARGTS